jgi:hypothetical protein
MKGLSGLLLATSVLALSRTTAGQAARADTDVDAAASHGFERFLRRYEAANTAFVNGDPQPWLAITAEQDPASIFGGFGGRSEPGVANVHQRFLLAAGAFQPSGAVVDFDYLVKDVRGTLAYTVALERAQVRHTGVPLLQEHFLRVTMLFRMEKGDWKIVHRHADTMVELELPRP